MTNNRPLKTDMAWEWNWPTFWSPNYHINFISFDVEYQRQGDHSPGFHCCLVICNLKLLDFGYYNIHHAPDDEE